MSDPRQTVVQADVLSLSQLPPLLSRVKFLDKSTYENPDASETEYEREIPRWNAKMTGQQRMDPSSNDIAHSKGVGGFI
jgi:hypothetical protein